MFYEFGNYNEEDEMDNPSVESFHLGLCEYYYEHLMHLFDDKYWYQLTTKEKSDITAEYREDLQEKKEDKERRTKPELFYMTAGTR